MDAHMNDMTTPMHIDSPVDCNRAPGDWGSDYLAEVMRALGIEHVVLVPGASFRGLHDSLVNHLGNARPAMLLTLHEETAVAIAHGYAKVTGKPMGVILHSNVGAHARDDGDLQRVLRSRADADLWRDRADGRACAPAVDRLDPHLHRSGRA